MGDILVTRTTLSDWNTVLCSNGVVAIWHPEKPFPFEHTNPINLDNEAKERQVISYGILTINYSILDINLRQSNSNKKPRTFELDCLKIIILNG